MLSSKKTNFLDNNFKIILDKMIPGDKFMPCFSRAVKISSIIKKHLKNKDILKLKNKKIRIIKKSEFDIYQKILGNDILEAYFTSDSVINALNYRKKYYLNNMKKENIFKLIKKVKQKKKLFRK